MALMRAWTYLVERLPRETWLEKCMQQGGVSQAADRDVRKTNIDRLAEHV